MPQSALIMEVPWAEPVVGPWRRAHDAISHRGVPAHITILYPFRAPDALPLEVDAFPDCPPHGGRFPALRPHVTIGQDPEPERIDLLHPEREVSVSGPGSRRSRR